LRRFKTDSDDESFYITQNSFRQNAANESDFDPSFFEWIGNVSYTPQNEKKEISSGIQENAALPIIRKIALVSDEELKRRQEDRIPEKTKSNTAWCLRTWTEWAKERSTIRSSLCINERYRVVNADMLEQEQEEEELCYWLSKFIVEVKPKKNPGMPYPHNTLYHS
jgi:hypothetical protein